MMKAFRFLIALLLIPLCVAATQTLLGLVRSLQPSTDAMFSPAVIALTSGFFLWLLIYFTLPHPVRSYVLAHELTHALWGTAMGARVLRMQVSKSRGSVTLTKNNFLITLAPYFFPLYTMIVVAGYYALSIVYDVQKGYLVWLALIGFTWAFHVTFTLSSLFQRQTDIQEYGRLFSYTVVALLNVIGICLWTVMVSTATLEQMISLLAANTQGVATSLWNGIGVPTVTFVHEKGLLKRSL